MVNILKSTVKSRLKAWRSEEMKKPVNEEIVIDNSITLARGGAPIKSSSAQPSTREVIFVRSAQPLRRSVSRTAGYSTSRSAREAADEQEADDVIDLGAPRPRARRASAPASAARRALPPNPRLYPGPKPKPKARLRPRCKKRALRPLNCVPNSRLYRPGAARVRAPPPPPARPRAAWPPPAPARALDTASRAALRLPARGASPTAPPSSPGPPASPASPAPAPSRRLVVTLPAGAARYRPASEHFRARVRAGCSSGASTPPAARLPRREMEPAGRQSSSPEDRSEGNEPLSAPSEFLAEFLSAIMRRQYAEALKYCRLILQYEPHNATARGFYPLLRHKVARAQRTEAAAANGSDSSGDEADAAGAARHSAEDSPRSRQDLMEHSAESEGESEASAAGDHSELELDSSDALHSSPSLSLSRRTDRTDRTDGTDSASGASAGCWESTGSASRSEPGDADDNGNEAAPAPAHVPVLPTAAAPTQHVHLLPDDVENDNAAGAGAGAGAGGGEPHHSARLKNESATLQRLRAQFACSIK